ncbi:unannotated protein [freshwater metagenome]|uniref:Unannotated protein n=1 Tax=freshwater metagenome TaxID=449393 RepID=A0A6J6UJG6_9ZZZZ
MTSIPNACMRWATNWPIRPKPTIPRVFSNSSAPVNLERAHLPFRSAACAGDIKRADASNNEIASSAALTMLDVGALTTMTPAAVAAGISTLSKPTPARAITFKPFAAAIASASILVAERIKTASTPLARAAKSSPRSAPSQLTTSKSGPSASNVAGLNSSAIRTTGLATRRAAFLVIIGL